MNRYQKSSEWLIRQITVGEVHLEDAKIRDLAKGLDLPLGDCGYFCIALRVESTGQEMMALFQAVLAAGKNLPNDVFSYISNHETILLMLSDEGENRSATVERIHQSLQKRIPCPFQLGIGRSYRDLGKLSYSRMEALEALGEDRAMGICYVDDLYVSRQFTTRKLESQRRRVIELFKTGHLAEMKKNMELLAENIRGESFVRADAPYPTSIRRTVLEVLLEVIHIASDAGVDVEKLMNHQDPYTHVFESSATTPLLISWLGDVAEKIQSAMQERQNKTQHHMLEKAKRCISLHLSDPQLSLTLISEELAITPTYFSAFFIRETGIGFNEYVTGLRMERAKELLEKTEEKINRIAEKCGFRSASYFIVVFRKQTGLSPNEYRYRK